MERKLHFALSKPTLGPCLATSVAMATSQVIQHKPGMMQCNRYNLSYTNIFRLIIELLPVDFTMASYKVADYWNGR